MTLTAGTDDDGRRLDRILRKALPDTPLSGIHRLLRKGRVLVNGKAAAPEDRIAAGAIITVPDSAAPPLPASRSAGGAAEDLPQTPGPPLVLTNGARLERRGGQSDGTRRKKMPGKWPPLPSPNALNILREEDDLLFINKPAGLAVHGPGSLDDLVRAYLADKLHRSLSFRPGPLHRLDKPTSGVIVFSKTLEGARAFSALIREGRIKKQYLAVVEGLVKGPELWEDLLVRDPAARKTFTAGGREAGAGPRGSRAAGTAKPARTWIRPLALSVGRRPAGDGGKFSLILAEIDTGRTHQIRSQAAAHGFPLAGDKKYGGAYQNGGFLLHAWKLELPEPGGGEAGRRTVCAPAPENFRRRIGELFGAVPEL
jgi:23S rRNA pseudouridine955/2504/2580 synthase